MRKPSRMRNSCRAFITGTQIMSPAKKVIARAERKPSAVLSSAISAITSGTSMVLENSINKMPSMRRETEICMG
jgi:hypothetical protein